MTPCLWCAALFNSLTRGGHAKKFCSVACKHEFETVARSYTIAAVEAGDVSVTELKRVYLSRATRRTQSGAPTTAEPAP